MTPALMQAILAMDAYNRTNNAAHPVRIKELGDDGSPIGTASVLQIQTTPSGFVGVAYSMADGSTTISYRGTDFNGWVGPNMTDVFNGWGLMLGSPFATQARDALNFYLSITQGVDPRDVNVILTGHSLGGGLAGLIGSLYGKAALLFDNIGFQAAAQSAYSISAEAYQESVPSESSYELLTAIYGTDEPWPIDWSNISALNIESEVAGSTRSNVSQPLNLGNTVLLGDRGIDPVSRHSISLLTIRLFAQEQNVSDAWQPAAKFIFPVLENNAIGSASGALQFQGDQSVGLGVVTSNAIAYSALDEGTLVFGKTGIRALYNDAVDVGPLFDNDALRGLLSTDAAKAAVGKIVVQYAADLAFQKSEADSVLNGTLATIDNKLLYIDLDPAKWVKSTEAARDGDSSADANIIGRTELIDEAFNWSQADRSNWTGSPGDITRMLIAYDDQGAVLHAGEVPLTGRDRDNDGSIDPGGAFIVGGGGNDEIVGGNGNDILIGGAGNDRIHARNGSDVAIGGDGDDILVAEAFTDIEHSEQLLIGGAGQDTFVIGSITPNFGGEVTPFHVVIADATAEDRLFVPRSFFNDTADIANPSLDGAALFPLLGAFGDENYAQLSSSRLSGDYPLRGEDGRWWWDFDFTAGLIQFLGHIEYELVDTSMFIRIARGHAETNSFVPDPGDPPPPEAQWTTNEWGWDGLVIEIKNWSNGALGIRFSDPEPWSPAGPGVRPEYDSDLRYFLNNGTMTDPLADLRTPPELNLNNPTLPPSEGTDPPPPPPPTSPEATSDPQLIQGTPGNDSLLSEKNSTDGLDEILTILGLLGDDYLESDMGADFIDLGAGIDTISFRAHVGGVTVDLGGDGVPGSSSDGDQISGAENLIGSAFDDIISGNTGDNALWGQAGSDTIDGRGGRDQIDGGDGNDVLTGGAGNDALFGGAGSDVAVYSGASSSYRITRQSTGAIVVEDLRTGSADGTDQLSGVEFLQFTDRVVDLSTFGGYASPSFPLSSVNSAPQAPSTNTVNVVEDTASMTFSVDASDSNGDVLSYALKAGFLPSLGTAVLNTATGTFTYTPNTNVNGTDAFTIIISDGKGGTAEQRVTVHIAPTNDAPVAGADATIAVASGMITTIDASALLANDIDVDGDGLSILSIGAVAGGMASLNAQGNIAFTPTAGYSGSASITYTVSDGHGGTTIAIANLVVGRIVNGTSADDTLVGSAGNDVFKIVGDAGTDAIDGGLGIDTLQGSVYNDVFRVNATGNNWTSVEVLDGGAGNDSIRGTTGNDVIDLTGLTVLSIENIDGAAGDDTITGTAGADTITGGTGMDQLFGGDGNDVFAVVGDGDLDTVSGGLGIDTLQGSAYNDVFRVNAAGNNWTSAEVLDGGAGTDSIKGTAGNDVIDLTGLTVLSIENIDGAAGDDIITGTSGADTITGGTGADQLFGGDGNDVFAVVGDGDLDTIDGGLGIDTLQGSAYNDVFRVNAAGNNWTSVEVLDGGAGTDSIKGTAGNDVINLTGLTVLSIENIDGAAGDDTIIGTAGADTITGGSGMDQLFGGDGNDVFAVVGDGDVDTVNGGLGVDTLQGSAYNDVFRVNATGNNWTSVEVIDGGAGTDAIKGTTGNDVIDLSGLTVLSIENIDGAAGDDTIIGTVGVDRFTGGSGNDAFVFQGQFGNDVISDFAAGAAVGDVLRISHGSSFDSYAEIMAAATQVGTSTVITFDALTSITLQNVQKANLVANDFAFF